MRPKEIILCAALLFKPTKSEKTEFIIGGFRHSDCFLNAGVARADIDDWDIDAGFLTSQNRFVTRAEAAEIAFCSGQIADRVDILISEDLY